MTRRICSRLALAALSLIGIVSSTALDGPRVFAAPQAASHPTYQAVNAFALDSKAIDVANLVLKRDRMEMTLTGTVYLAAPIDGRVTGAVFMGQGAFHAAVPASDFERGQVRRLLGADAVDSDFKTAVMRFNDDTAAMLDGRRRDVAPPEDARRLAAGFSPEWLTTIGVNVSARVALSLINQEAPGLWLAGFDGGQRGRFAAVLDPQMRVPSSNFRINSGEKGVIFQYLPVLYTTDVWMAFYELGDYERGQASYSDQTNLVDITHYKMSLDLRDPAKKIGLTAQINLTSRASPLRAIPFKIGESLSGYQSTRLKKQLRVKAARFENQPLPFLQEDWEGGFTVFLPRALSAGDAVSIELDLEGDFLRDDIRECFYPESNTEWFPRHGELDRATFDITYRSRKRDRIASIGARVSELPDPADAETLVTRFEMTEPVALAVFAVGPFERKTDPLTPLASGKPIEFNSVPTRVISIKDDFIVAELGNTLQYFSKLFGHYPYATFGAAFHPYNFGQGFPTLLMIPPTDRGEKRTFVFLAHEAAHQWWGNVVSWRSYRDQWLSEGFAEYSGILYTGKRDKEESATLLIKELRESLLDPPHTAQGLGKGRLNDIGPIVLGLRLNTTKTLGTYQTLIYNKGALVLRMLHFLLSRPDTGDDAGFNAMMTDFVNRYRNKAASTDDFRVVATEHFARSPIGQKYGLRDLNWFFRQWVHETDLPSYQLEYEIKERDGGIYLAGTIRQDAVPADWFMVLPLVMTFDGNQSARTAVKAQGPVTPFELKVPARPKKVELDPAKWILSEKTITKTK